MVTLLNTEKKCRVSVYDNKTKSIFLNLYSMNEQMLEKAFSILTIKRQYILSRFSIILISKYFLNKTLQ